MMIPRYNTIVSLEGSAEFKIMPHSTLLYGKGLLRIIHNGQRRGLNIMIG